MPPTHDTPRSLADALRSWDDAALAALLRSRPDLAVPLPADLTTLAARAASRSSVQRAVDALSAPELQVVEILAVLPEPATPGQVTAAWGTSAAAVLQRLRDLALVWGSPRRLYLVRAVRDALGPYPAGLGPTLEDTLRRRSPELADRLRDQGALAPLLAQVPDAAREVLDRLTWGPPIGQFAHADREVDAASTAPVEWLLARGLLGVADAGHVLLPREVALALREARVHRAPQVRPPDLAPVPGRAVQASAAAAAAEAVRLVEALGTLWGSTRVPVLRAGGLGVRELRRTALALEIDEPTAAMLIELAYAAGLVGDDGELEPRWAPTPAYDAWLARGTGSRWARLAEAWLDTTRCPSLVGTRDAKDAARAVLGHDLDRAAAPEVRRWALVTLAGEAPDAVVTPVALQALLDWTAPRRVGPLRAALLDAALAEAAWLGVTGAGALAPCARPLLEGDPARAADLLETALPEPVDHILLQADLTAIAPGPLEPELAGDLELAADVESRGGATVFRFTPSSIRRALDAGRTADDLVAWLREHSRTPVPQPLEYLITDAARRHGLLRVGTAVAFLRSDDEAALSELIADRRAEALRLRRLAPTVLAAQAAPEVVLQVLRSMGLSPAAESTDGAVVLPQSTAYRTGPRSRPRPLRPTAPTPSPAALLSAASALRLTDAATAPPAPSTSGPPSAPSAPGATSTSPPLPPASPIEVATLLALLRQAANRRSPVWVGYVDSDGVAAQRLVEPLQVDGGRVSAFDRQTASVRTIPISRVTAVTPVA